MAGVIASLALLCSVHAQGGPGRATACPLRLARSVLAAAPARPVLEPAALQGPLVARVQAALRGVTLFGSGPAADAAGATFQLRPHFGAKGPEAMLDLRF